MVEGYVVHYGENTSFMEFTAWAEAARFIKHCLDNDTTVRAVQKCLVKKSQWRKIK